MDPTGYSENPNGSPQPNPEHSPKTPLNINANPPPPLKAQFARIVEVMYAGGRNLDKDELARMEAMYVLGAHLSLVNLEFAVTHPIDSVGHNILEAHRLDIVQSMARVSSK